MQPNTDKYIEHLKSCAQLANDIAAILGLRDDTAKQSCFATLVINADRYGVFMEPQDQNGVRPNGHAKDKQAAEKADAQIAEIDPAPTTEKSDQVERDSLLGGIRDAVELLNKLGHTPTITDGGLNAYIKKEFVGKPSLKMLDNEDLGKLLAMLCEKVNKQKAKQAETKTADQDVGF